MKQVLGFERVIQIVGQFKMFGVIQTFPGRDINIGDTLFYFADTPFGERNGTTFFVNVVIPIRLFVFLGGVTLEIADIFGKVVVQAARLIRRAKDDEWNTSFINKNIIYFI